MSDGCRGRGAHFKAIIACLFDWWHVMWAAQDEHDDKEEEEAKVEEEESIYSLAP